MSMTVLLDTCVFLWLADEKHRLSARAREILEDRSITLRLHQVTPWEIQIKHSLGKLPLPHPPRIAVPAAIEKLGLDYRTRTTTPSTPWKKSPRCTAIPSTASS